MRDTAPHRPGGRGSRAAPPARCRRRLRKGNTSRSLSLRLSRRPRGRPRWVEPVSAKPPRPPVLLGVGLREPLRARHERRLVGRVGRHVDRDGADGQREISPTATLERARAAGSEGAPRSPGPPGPANLAAGNEDAPVGEDVPTEGPVWSGQPPLWSAPRWSIKGRTRTRGPCEARAAAR